MYATPGCAGSAVTLSLSLNGNVGSASTSWMTSVASPYVLPPSVDTAAPIALLLSFALNEIETWYARPSGPTSTHGSDARSYGIVHERCEPTPLIGHGRLPK